MSYGLRWSRNHFIPVSRPGSGWWPLWWWRCSCRSRSPGLLSRTGGCSGLIPLGFFGQCRGQAFRGLCPGYTRNPININVPNTIKKLLQDINNKPITSIQLAPNVTVEMKAPLKMSAARIEQIYQWLLGKPCGTKALYDYLKMRGPLRMSRTSRLWP